MVAAVDDEVDFATTRTAYKITSATGRRPRLSVTLSTTSSALHALTWKPTPLYLLLTTTVSIDS